MNTYLICTDNARFMHRITQERLDRMSDDPESWLDLEISYGFTVQLAMTIRKFRDLLATDSSGYSIVKELDAGIGALTEALRKNVGPADPRASVDSFARRNLDSQLQQKERILEEGEWEVMKEAMSAIRSILEADENYEACAKVRDLTKELGLKQLIKEIGQV
jgi:hypothetical protein